MSFLFGWSNLECITHPRQPVCSNSKQSPAFFSLFLGIYALVSPYQCSVNKTSLEESGLVCVAGSEHSTGVIQCVLPLDLHFRLAATVQGVSGTAGTLSAVPFPTTGETQPVHLPAESLTLPVQGKLCVQMWYEVPRILMIIIFLQVKSVPTHYCMTRQGGGGWYVCLMCVSRHMKSATASFQTAAH